MSDLMEAPAISDPERAAVMVMLLEDDQAAQILAQLEPAELRLLGEKMCALGEIGPVAIAQAIAGFVEKTERLGLIAHDRVGQGRAGRVQLGLGRRLLGPPRATVEKDDDGRALGTLFLRGIDVEPGVRMAAVSDVLEATIRLLGIRSTRRRPGVVVAQVRVGQRHRERRVRHGARREEVIQYIYARYGRQRAGLAATVITYRGRSAMREVGKVMGLSEDVTATLAGIVWGQMREEMHNGRLQEAGLDPDDPLLARVIELAHERDFQPTRPLRESLKMSREFVRKVLGY